MSRENAWFLNASEDNLEMTVERPGETGARHVITGVVASFDDPAIKSFIRLNEAAGAMYAQIHFVGQIAIRGLEIVLPVGADVGAFMPASGAAGTIGSVLINGYTK